MFGSSVLQRRAPPTTPNVQVRLTRVAVTDTSATLVCKFGGTRPIRLRVADDLAVPVTVQEVRDFCVQDGWNVAGSPVKIDLEPTREPAEADLQVVTPSTRRLEFRAPAGDKG